MHKLLLVGLGGSLGAMARYSLGGLVARLKSDAAFPYETLTVNVLGCLIIGFLAGLSETRGVLLGSTRTFVFIGLLGGFTTFSSFGYETMQLLRDGQVGSATISVCLNVFLGFAAVWVGDVLARVVGGA